MSRMPKQEELAQYLRDYSVDKKTKIEDYTGEDDRERLGRGSGCVETSDGRGKSPAADRIRAENVRRVLLEQGRV